MTSLLFSKGVSASYEKSRTASASLVEFMLRTFVPSKSLRSHSLPLAMQGARLFAHNSMSASLSLSMSLESLADSSTVYQRQIRTRRRASFERSRRCSTFKARPCRSSLTMSRESFTFQFPLYNALWYRFSLFVLQHLPILQVYFNMKAAGKEKCSKT